MGSAAPKSGFAGRGRGEPLALLRKPLNDPDTPGSLASSRASVEMPSTRLSAARRAGRIRARAPPASSMECRERLGAPESDRWRRRSRWSHRCDPEIAVASITCSVVEAGGTFTHAAAPQRLRIDCVLSPDFPVHSATREEDIRRPSKRRRDVAERRFSCVLYLAPRRKNWSKPR